MGCRLETFELSALYNIKVSSRSLKYINCPEKLYIYICFFLIYLKNFPNFEWRLLRN